MALFSPALSGANYTQPGTRPIPHGGSMPAPGALNPATAVFRAANQPSLQHYLAAAAAAGPHLHSLVEPQAQAIENAVHEASGGSNVPVQAAAYPQLQMLLRALAGNRPIAHGGSVPNPNFQQ